MARTREPEPARNVPVADSGCSTTFWLLISGVLGVAALWAGLWFARESASKGDGDGGPLLTWARANGAVIQNSVRSQTVNKSGISMQGLFTETSMKVGVLAVQVPKSLWLDLLSLDTTIDYETPECGAGMDRKAVFFAVKVAVEIKRGSDSKFYEYLKTMPTISQYSSHHPYVADDNTRAAFGALPILRIFGREHAEQFEQKWQACIDGLNRTSPHGSLKSLDYADIVHARMIVMTRVLGQRLVPLKTLVPVADLVNHGTETEANAVVAWEENQLVVITTRDIPAGGEIIVSYCNDCDNEILLAKWGVYMEHLPQGLNDIATANCTAEAIVEGHESNPPGSEAPVSLQAATLAELDPDLDIFSKNANAPKCRENIPPVRCFLARLAWDTCSQAWGFAESPKRGAAHNTHSARLYHCSALNGLGLLRRRHDTEKDLKAAGQAFKAALKADPSSEVAARNLKAVVAKQKERSKGAESQGAVAEDPESYQQYTRSVVLTDDGSGEDVDLEEVDPQMRPEELKQWEESQLR